MIRVLGLLALGAMAWGQALSDADAAALIEKAREKALAYTRSLPDFVCTEVVHRYVERDPQTIRGLLGAGMSMNTAPAAIRWTPADKLTIKLSYFQQQEDHKLVLVNDQPTEQKYEALPGGVESGEFGGSLAGIFEPATATSFHWESWKNVRRHRTAVYRYEVDEAHSRYEVASGNPEGIRRAIVRFSGVLEIDRETGEVVHFTYVADGIPKGLHLDSVSTAVEYDFADIAGRDYLLPSHCETEIHSPKLSVRNVMDFREYRKFSADSSVEFGTPK